VRVSFIEPPRDRQTGGLGAAIAGLRAALEACGVVVLGDSPVDLRAADIVHFHGLWEFRYRALARRSLRHRIPYVISPHGMLEPWALRHKRWKKLPYFVFWERGMLTRAGSLVATSVTEARSLKEALPGSSVSVLPLGLTGRARPAYDAARRERGWGQDERVLLFLSRIHPKKGLDLLLQALRGWRQGRLVIVGGGDSQYVSHLRAYCEVNAHDLPRVDWVGELWGEARWSYLQGADLFCLPSHSENFGLAVLEACQVGTPVLTTTMTPWPEVMAAMAPVVAKNSFACEPSVVEVRRALNRYSSTPRPSAGERSAVADWAWDTFDWRVLGPRYLDFYVGLKRLGA
jgi:glycosyltransferase involved in cell wall biosynthesis